MYTQDNYRKVTDIIEKRRLSAIADADAKNAEVEIRSEEIRKIDAELRGTGLLIFKTACAGGDIAPIRERNLALTKRRCEVLLSLGLPEDYTEPKYTCKKCSDTGFDKKGRCTCFSELLITENIRSSGMGNLITKQSFENFKLERYKDDPHIYERMKENLEAAKAFAENFESGISTMLFIGTTGTGKTHLSTAIAKAVIEKGFSVLYDSAQNIISAFEHDRFKSGYGPYEPKGDKYNECDLLIIDDLGTEFVNQFTLSCLYNLINTRQNAGRKTIVSTNISPKELTEKYDDRIYSRLMGCDSRILFFAGKDLRFEN